MRNPRNALISKAFIFIKIAIAQSGAPRRP
jgi:hypothetical protein